MIPPLVTLILNFDLVLKNFNLGYIFEPNVLDIDALWRDLSFGTKTFDLVTFNFDLVLKNFNLRYIFWTMGDRILIIHIDTSWRVLSFCTKTSDLDLWPSFEKL
jgi:hypothetical protein